MTVTMSNHYVIKAEWDSPAMELIPDVFLVTIDWWSEITTSAIKRGHSEKPLQDRVPTKRALEATSSPNEFVQQRWSAGQYGEDE